jgi:hypothetical protein
MCDSLIGSSAIRFPVSETGLSTIWLVYCKKKTARKRSDSPRADFEK